MANIEKISETEWEGGTVVLVRFNAPGNQDLTTLREIFVPRDKNINSHLNKQYQRWRDCRDVNKPKWAKDKPHKKTI